MAALKNQMNIFNNISDFEIEVVKGEVGKPLLAILRNEK
jgi:hypothetical protein